MGKRRNVYPVVDILEILLSPITVRINGEIKKRDPFEAQLETCVTRALKGDIAACKRFVKLCLREGLIVKPVPYDDFRSFETVPKDWEWEDWMEMYWKYGPPPFPGARDGLTVEEREKLRASSRVRRKSKSVPGDQNG